MRLYLSERLAKAARSQWLKAQDVRRGGKRQRAHGLTLREDPGSVLQWSTTTPGAESF